MSQSGESALIIAVPEAEALVAPYRAKHDPSAASGAPAHITLLYPFKHPSAISGSLLAELRSFFSSRARFRFSLVEPRRFPDLLYLAPDPRTPFDRLTADLAARYPDTPPYGGAIAEPIPHLTVAYATEPRLSSLASEFARTAASSLPISCSVRSAVLLVNENGRWRTQCQFPLGADASA